MTLFVFDVDGTLYDLNDVVAQNYEIQVDFFCSRRQCSRQVAVDFFEENHVFPRMTEKSRSATELLLRSGFDRDDWNGFRQARYPVESIRIEHAVDAATMIAFKKLGRCVLLSSNSLNTIRRILNRLNIPEAVFDKILCSDSFPYDRPFNKHDAFSWIKEVFGNECEICYSIGDRFKTDILPACEVGYSGILIDSCESIRQLLTDCCNMKSGRANGYHVYPPINKE